MNGKSKDVEGPLESPRLPAEWEPHAGTWIAWPHQRGDWPGKFAPVPWAFAEIVRLLARRERVWLVVQKGERAKVEDRLAKAGADLRRVTFVKKTTDRCWLRDSGPMVVHRDRDDPIVVDWKFNAWAKYPNHEADDRVPRKAAKAMGLKRVRPQALVEGLPVPVVLEGGAIDSNGRGTLLTTEECMLSAVQKRNPGLGRAELEAVFAQYLGVRNVVWLDRGIVGDDTHGHVDDIVRFVNPTTVVAVVEDDFSDPNYEVTRENLSRLREARDQEGSPFEVVTLPMPRPVVFEGQRLPASYANFYVANGTVLVPTFNDVNDRTALATLAGLFPDREVVGVHAVDLVWGLGTIHCLARDVVGPLPEGEGAGTG